jgi:WD40 repeat protein
MFVLSLLQILSGQRFVCQCGTGIKVVQTSVEIKPEKQEDMEIDDEDDDDSDLRLILEKTSIQDKKHGSSSSSTSFCIEREIEVPMDEIISFDACPVTNTLITSHKSRLLRIWCLLTGEVIKVIKSIHALPIGFIEINKTKAWEDFSETKVKVEGEKQRKPEDAARGQLSWCTVAGAGVKLWEMGGNQMSRLIPVDNIASIGYVRWGVGSSKNQLFVAERHIYILGTSESNKQFGVLRTLEGHYSQVTGIEFDGTGHLIR